MIIIFNEIVEHIMVERNKHFDTAILGEIEQIAIDNDIFTTVHLNEDEIIKALQLYIGLKNPQNNYYRIKAMSVDELAEFMRSMLDCVSCQNKLMNSNPLGDKKCSDTDYFKMCGGDFRKCHTVCRQWLLQENLEWKDCIKK